MAEFDIDTKTKEMLISARKVAIVPSVVDGADSFAAAVGLYRMLSSKGKEASILYPGTVPAGLEGITEGINISTSMGNRSLVVSIDYSGTTASKVNYTTENDVLSFYLTPIDHDFDLSKVKTEITGPDYDLYVTIGVQSPEDTGALRDHLQAEILKSKVLNIDNNSLNTRFGTLYLVDASMKSLSLLVLNKAPKWDLVIDQRSAKALTTGISR
ncbi:MAG: hypothetical protein ACD_25C00066G0002 [uncultured bacterium]|uniref:Uncharacterized protein n=1 Tax=candidate division WWE3 bacterium TaxID=2053526 RepID=A0A656PLW8_UNCKA|nr:hypothetical protein P147_WWE3C00001G0023 [candidate division WWE3 bacterium RAAC2_WWE3_1]EKD95123.1 MAG: hypothetical protein ACD_25C00066G0002 [uncultured bacterium]KKS29072.1 MAG: hypothetical protein UU91_C0009G0006 [candidate division WWE3 bacterium GW2011_GWB1_42_117]KKS55132.1 MAG: hypothetical protein UV21_C0002G0006 [candidate division WWE3 bacterium GW2011_GWD2_42_34]KKT06104.1 MAG: hypothetical protein UV84_C0014G0015 [candidate division WWE3 bacterium GW2011_GWF2_43_18]KKT08193.